MIRRYFDNAATSFPKPTAMVAALTEYYTKIGASAGRGAYSEALASGRILDQARAVLRRLFQANAADAVIFTHNGSDALNTAIKSHVRAGDHVVTTVMDHNSVLRPLSALAERSGVTWTAVPADPQTTLVPVSSLAAAIRPTTRLVAVNHASNVTGALQDIDSIANLCRERGVRLLVDAAQTAGHVPIDLTRTPIDFLALPGHKGLLGPLGTGILLIRGDAASELISVREGGTGSVSELPVMPETLPDKFEAGSHNAAGISGLLASVNFILERGVERLREHELALTRGMMAEMERCAGLTWYGPRDERQRVGVFSVRVDGFSPAELSALLEGQFGLLTRSGLHCAPLAHETIGTLRDGGTTRLSLGCFHTQDDIELVAAAFAAL